GGEEGAAVRRLEHRQAELEVGHRAAEAARGLPAVRRALAQELELRRVTGQEMPAVRMQLEDLGGLAVRARPVDGLADQRLRAVGSDVPQPPDDLREAPADVDVRD